MRIIAWFGFVDMRNPDTMLFIFGCIQTGYRLLYVWPSP